MAKAKKMTKAEMRVAIAKDVLKAIDARRIVPARIGYIRIGDEAAEARWRKRVGLDAWDGSPDTVPEKPIRAPKACQVCAIGSVFVAAVDRFDALTFEDADAAIGESLDDTMVEYLAPWFSEDQLRLMEMVFECSDVDCRFTDMQLERASAMAARADEAPGRERSPTKRMRAIMLNIIKNKGRFVLPKALA